MDIRSFLAADVPKLIMSESQKLLSVLFVSPFFINVAANRYELLS
jgi:hypothetical protein